VRVDLCHDLESVGELMLEEVQATTSTD
jgi:hypothetical protein